MCKFSPEDIVWKSISILNSVYKTCFSIGFKVNNEGIDHVGINILNITKVYVLNDFYSKNLLKWYQDSGNPTNLWLDTECAHYIHGLPLKGLSKIDECIL